MQRTLVFATTLFAFAGCVLAAQTIGGNIVTVQEPFTMFARGTLLEKVLLPEPWEEQGGRISRPIVRLRFGNVNRDPSHEVGLPIRRTPGFEMICEGPLDEELDLVQVGDRIRLFTRPIFPAAWSCEAQIWHIAGDTNCEDPQFGDWPMYCVPSPEVCTSHRVRPWRGRLGTIGRGMVPRLCAMEERAAARQGQGRGQQGTVVGLPVPAPRSGAHPPGVASRRAASRPGTVPQKTRSKAMVTAPTTYEPRRDESPVPQPPPSPAPPPAAPPRPSSSDPAARARVDRDGTARYTPDSAVDATLQLNLRDAVGGYLQVGEVLVGRAPRAYALGDVNADGRADIVVARAGEKTVRVFLATSDGGLRQVYALDLERGPCAMTMGEFDGGPSADVAVAFCSSDGVADDAWLILIGDGKGNLVPGTASEHPLKLSVDDLNQDGAEDIVALDRSGAAQEFFFSNAEVGATGP